MTAVCDQDEPAGADRGDADTRSDLREDSSDTRQQFTRQAARIDRRDDDRARRFQHLKPSIWRDGEFLVSPHRPAVHGRDDDVVAAVGRAES
ncbi:hypothetical protein [Streptomyces sp. WG7]|uniref:hypothetical protein n=1 Tax=Streptomyces sp. WG7 TaxID=3417650 RepID=UPI003CF5433B